MTRPDVEVMRALLADQIERAMGHSSNERGFSMTGSPEEWATILAALRSSGTGRSEAEAKESASKVCHDEQMTVWSGEVIAGLEDHLRDDLSYDDMVDALAAVSREVRSIVESAFYHPELAARTALSQPAKGEA